MNSSDCIEIYRVEKKPQDAAQHWHFKTAEQVGTFMWGRRLSHYSFYKNGVQVFLDVADVAEIIHALEQA